MEAGIDDVGLGVLFGLNTYRYDFTGLLMHAEHLETTFGVGPHTISVPRICPADDISTQDFPDAISDDIFCKIVAVIRIAVPYTGMIISTRESAATRRKVLNLGISQISGGSRTSVGGYAIPETPEENSAQFDISDTRYLGRGSELAARLGAYPQFLYSMLSGRAYRRPFYVISQIGTNRQLLRPQCIDDTKRVSGRLCGTGYTSQRNPTDKKRVGTYSQSENKRNSNS